MKILRNISVALAAVTALPTMALAADAASTAANASDSTGQIQEIIVTAQRRSEREQDVPVSMTTVTAEAAAKLGVTGTESLSIAVPALQFSRQTGNGGTPFIRGVGSSEGTAGAESPVAVYVDDVYVGSPAATLFQFNNIDSIEVLKGPQGTLFGRNATGGVVSIHTREPSQEGELDANIGYGNFNTSYASLYATGGLTNTLSGSIAVAGKNQADGYGRNIVTGQQTLLGYSYGARGELLWKPDEDTSLLLTEDASNRKDDAGMSVVLTPGTYGIPGMGGYVSPFGTYDTPKDYSEASTSITSAKLTHDFGPVSLVSVTAFRDTNMHWDLDVDGDPTEAVYPNDFLAVYYHLLDEAFSQEFRVLSDSKGPFKWIGGVFFYDANSKYDPQTLYGFPGITGPGGFRQLFLHTGLRSYAGFGEVTWEFLKDTHLTAGLRYTRDHLCFDQTLVSAAGVATPSIPERTSTNFSKPTWRVTLDHSFTPDLLGYATVSTGFKSGRYNTLAATDANNNLVPPVAPELLTAYEAGFKSELFDHKILLNASGFYYNYTNLQVSIIKIGFSSVENAAAAHIKGADFDLHFVPNRYLDISGGMEFLEAKYSSFPNGPYFIANPSVCTSTPAMTGPATGGFNTCSVNLAGNYLSRAPKFTASLAGTLTIPTSAGDVAINASLYHNGGFYWEPDNNVEQKSYDLLTSVVSWSPNKTYTFKLFGKNLTNKYYLDYYSTGGLRAAGSPAEPRNYGIEFDLHLK